jgi:hypothetical protein
MMGVTVERAALPANLHAFSPEASGKPEAAQAGGVALLPGSPENFKVINAALRGGGSASILRAPQASWPAGTVVLDAAAAQTAAPVAIRAGVSWKALASAPGNLEKLRAPRVGLYKPWAASMDEGWTRWLLEQYGFDPKSLDNKTVRGGKLSEKFDAIVLPDVEKDVIDKGKPKREEGEMKYFADLPAEYAGGLEKEGGKALKEFVESGGTLVAFASSSDYVMDEFNIPARNVLARTRPDDFSCPGSLLRVKVTPGHPVTYGLSSEAAIFLDKSIAYATALPGMEMERWVLASYPESGRDVLLSGWIRGEERLARQAAAVAVTYGKGKIVLLGFRPQHRAQTNGTYPFVFNALYWSTPAR